MKSFFGLSLALAVQVQALPTLLRRDGLPAYFLLAGDSTSATGGGWGDGFLSTALTSEASGHNYGHSGATTASFRSGGDWDTVISQISEYAGDYAVYVTIQFGHNDQKEDSGVSIEDYEQNLLTMATEVKDAQATPILITPLTRRSFDDSGKIVENLAEEREITISVAEQADTWIIDLNQRSTEYCNALGEDSWTYNLEEDDRTHLNDWGSVVFGRLVSDLLVEGYPELEEWTEKNETMSALLAEGKLA